MIKLSLRASCREVTHIFLLVVLLEIPVLNGFREYGDRMKGVRLKRERWRTVWGRDKGEGLTAGAGVARVAVEEAVSDPDVRPRGRVS